MEYSITGQILKINYTGLCDNNITKVIDYQILADTLMIKLKKNENRSVFLPIKILLKVMESDIFVWHPGQYTNLNSTLDTDSVNYNLSVVYGGVPFQLKIKT